MVRESRLRIPPNDPGRGGGGRRRETNLENIINLGLWVPAMRRYRATCVYGVARVRLRVIYRGGLSECQKYRIIIPRSLARFVRAS